MSTQFDLTNAALLDAMHKALIVTRASVAAGSTSAAELDGLIRLAAEAHAEVEADLRAQAVVDRLLGWQVRGDTHG